MVNQGKILGAVLGASLVVGCADSGVDEIDDFEFRSSPGPEDGSLGYAGNGDIVLRTGSGDNEPPDIIIWDIAGGGVTRQVEPGVFEPRLDVDGAELNQTSIDATGLAGPACTAAVGDHTSGKEFKLVDAGGAVVLTLWERYVFVGDVDIPADAVENGLGMALESQIAFSFKKRRIYAGHWTDDDVVAIASEKIAKASPMRRLTLGALVTGECGSNGLP